MGFRIFPTQGAGSEKLLSHRSKQKITSLSNDPPRKKENPEINRDFLVSEIFLFQSATRKTF